MEWKHREPWATGKACIIMREFAADRPYALGAITTGKQRVFHRYFVSIALTDNSVATGEDEYDLRGALYALDAILRERGIVLFASGLDERWIQSGLQQGTCWAWWPDCDRPVHIMELPPPTEHDQENEALVYEMIREAIDGMFPHLASTKATGTRG